MNRNSYKYKIAFKEGCRVGILLGSIIAAMILLGLVITTYIIIYFLI